VDNHPALACCDAAWHAPIMSILEMLHARLTARKIGQDRFGNIYYEARKTLPVYNRKRRYVVTAHGQDPTKVPAEWHAWLHHTTDAPLDETRRLPWQKEHQPNLTGTPGAWRPKGHDYSGGQRRVTGGDYEAWTP
jgi:NADH:ubiquinone oxidoreductase subunit